MIIEGLEQQTPEWYTMRKGMVTGSRVADIVTRLKKGGYSAARQTYLMEIACARLTGLMPDHHVSPAMEWGIANEPFARAAFELANDCMVESIGFAIHPKIEYFGASPDGLIGEEGVLEIKCPTSDTHLSYILAGVVPVEYCPQMLAEMACTERQFCDFVSFDPRMPENLQLFMRRFHRDDKLIAMMEEEVQIFLGEVEGMLETINQLRPVLP
jgi:putative phage-type endonuclease